MEIGNKPEYLLTSSSRLILVLRVLVEFLVFGYFVISVYCIEREPVLFQNIVMHIYLYT